ncbi:MAG TPA: pyruvate dehydrogenase complex E1 component subunit beta, partial [Bacteroidia bacterium]|nr:pyruvate dehydrogenase complex E1 component subunit beta [Bacteroidia bacterium]
MREIQFREALREALSEEMRRDPNVFLMGEEVAQYNGAYKVSQGMLDEFGAKRVIDTPIAELGFAGIGVGAAMNGLRPVIEFMTFNFSLVAIDQVINAAAKMKSMSGGQYGVPIVFRGPTASAGMLSSQHSQAFESWYANCPGLKVIVPSNPKDAKGLLKAAIRDDDPVIFMESEQMYGDKGEVPEGEYLMPIGVADIKRAGNDVTIVSFGKIIKTAYKAAEELAKENIDVEIIDLRTVRPIDYATVIASVKKTNRMVIIEESWPLANIATEVAFKVQREAFDYLDAPVLRVTGGDVPLPYAPTLIDAYLPNPERI